MERPFFSLAKRKLLKPIEYVSPNGEVFVNVFPNTEFGMTTIWDADVLIWAACRRPLSSQTSARRKAKNTGRSAGLNPGPEESQQSMGMGLTLSDWFHEGILMDGGLLSFDPVYSRSRVAANAGFTASRVSTRAGRGRKASSVSWSKTCRD